MLLVPVFGSSLLVFCTCAAAGGLGAAGTSTGVTTARADDAGVGAEVGGDVGGSVGGDVGGSVGGLVGGSVCGLVGGSVGGDVGGSVGGLVGGSVGGLVGGSVGGEVGGRQLSGTVTVAELLRGPNPSSHVTVTVSVCWLPGAADVVPESVPPGPSVEARPDTLMLVEIVIVASESRLATVHVISSSSHDGCPETSSVWAYAEVGSNTTPAPARAMAAAILRGRRTDLSNETGNCSPLIELLRGRFRFGSPPITATK